MLINSPRNAENSENRRVNREIMLSDHRTPGEPQESSFMGGGGLPGVNMRIFKVGDSRPSGSKEGSPDQTQNSFQKRFHKRSSSDSPNQRIRIKPGSSDLESHNNSDKSVHHWPNRSRDAWPKSNFLESTKHSSTLKLQGTLTQGGGGSDSQRSKFINIAEFNARANPTHLAPSIILDVNQDSNFIEKNKELARDYGTYRMFIIHQQTQKTNARVAEAKKIHRQEFKQKLERLTHKMNSNERSKQEKEIMARNVIFTCLQKIAQKEWLKTIYLHNFLHDTKSRFEALYNKVCRARLDMFHIVKFQTFSRKWLARSRATRDYHVAPTLGLVKNSLLMLAAMIKKRLEKINRKILGRIFPEFVRLDRLKHLLDKLHSSRVTLLYRMKAHYRNYSVKYTEFSREFERDLYEILSWEEAHNKRKSPRKAKYNNGTKLLDNMHRFGEEYKRALFKIVYNVRLTNHLRQVSSEAERMAEERSVSGKMFGEDLGRSS
jgi:hypothetical protein